MNAQELIRTLSWVHPDLMVAASPSGGNGVYASADIIKGTTVVMYGGHVMTLEQESALDDRIRDYPHQIDDHLVIGPSQVDEIQTSDYINHSCDPNCGFTGQIRLIAMRDIKKGEEVTFDYAMVVSQTKYVLSAYELECKCGSMRCRGTITANDWRLPELQSRYRGYFQEYIEKKIAHSDAED